MNILADRLQQLKIENDLLQKDIATDLGIPLRSYQRYESGEREPSATFITNVSIYFNVKPDYILGLSNFAEPLYFTKSTHSKPFNRLDASQRLKLYYDTYQKYKHDE